MSESELLPAKIMSDIMGPFATLLDNLKLLADSPNPDCQREFKAMADKNNEEKKEIWLKIVVLQSVEFTSNWIFMFNLNRIKVRICHKSSSNRLSYKANPIVFTNFSP